VQTGVQEAGKIIQLHLYTQFLKSKNKLIGLHSFNQNLSGCNMHHHCLKANNSNKSFESSQNLNFFFPIPKRFQQILKMDKAFRWYLDNDYEHLQLRV